MLPVQADARWLFHLKKERMYPPLCVILWVWHTQRLGPADEPDFVLFQPCFLMYLLKGLAQRVGLLDAAAHCGPFAWMGAHALAPLQHKDAPSMPEESGHNITASHSDATPQSFRQAIVRSWCYKRTRSGLWPAESLYSKTRSILPDYTS